MLQIVKSKNNHGRVKRIKQYNRYHVLNLSEDIACSDAGTFLQTIVGMVLGTVSVRHRQTHRERESHELKESSLQGVQQNICMQVSIPTQNIKQRGMWSLLLPHLKIVIKRPRTNRKRKSLNQHNKVIEITKIISNLQETNIQFFE